MLRRSTKKTTKAKTKGQPLRAKAGTTKKPTASASRVSARSKRRVAGAQRATTARAQAKRDAR
jgi:hypothetical protein